MSHPGRRPGWRVRAVGLPVVIVALVAAACGSNGADGPPPQVTYVTAQGGTITVGVDQAPTGCNPNTPTGRTAANLAALDPVLPSAFSVSTAGTSMLNTNLLVQAELVDTTPRRSSTPSTPRRCGPTGRPSPRPTSSTPGSSNEGPR